MTDALTDSIQTVVALMNKMTKEYALAHGRAIFSGADIDDGWDGLADQISSAHQQLNDVWSATTSHAEHRHIRAVEENLGEVHTNIERVASASAKYLEVEAASKKQMDSGGEPDMVTLEMARNRLEKSDQSLATSRSNLRNYLSYLMTE